MTKRAWLGFGVLMMGIFILVGCGQQTPTVNTANPQPGGLTIRGTVFDATVDANIGNPIAGATLILSGGQVQASGVSAASASQTWVAVSNANGEYAFTNLPANDGSGGYDIIASAEGCQRTILTGIVFGSLVQPADNSIITVDITLDGDPVVLSISPAPGTSIEAAAQTITVKFNEAMDPSTVRPTLTTQGLRGYAVSDTQTLTTAWSTDNKTLTITTGALLQNMQYRLQVDPAGLARDASGFRLETTPPQTSGGLDNTTYNQTTALSYYRTATGGIPGAPTGVLLTVNNLAVIDYFDANNGGNSVNLAWLAPSTGIVTTYRVYVSTGSSGPWSVLGASGSNAYSTNITTLNTALYGALYNADCINKLAFVTDPVYFKVVAFNADGEGAATAVSTRDAVKPTLVLADRTPGAVGVPAALLPALTNYAVAGADQNLGCYLLFSEPMSVATLTDATKYTSSGGQTVTSATLVYNNAGQCIVMLRFSAVIVPSVDTITVSTTGPTDLSGNVMDSAAGGNVKTMN